MTVTPGYSSVVLSFLSSGRPSRRAAVVGSTLSVSTLPSSTPPLDNMLSLDRPKREVCFLFGFCG